MYTWRIFTNNFANVYFLRHVIVIVLVKGMFEMAHKNIALKPRWKIRTSLRLRGQRARESILTCSNKLHGKFLVSRGAAVYRASGLNFSSICDISRANCSDYKSFARSTRCIFERVADTLSSLKRYLSMMEKRMKTIVSRRHVSSNYLWRIILTCAPI